MRVNSMALEYVNYIQWTPQTKWEDSFTIHTYMLNLEIWVELYSQQYVHEMMFIPRIFVGNIIHPNIIPCNYYS